MKFTSCSAHAQQPGVVVQSHATSLIQRLYPTTHPNVIHFWIGLGQIEHCERRLPSRGYTFATWLRIDELDSMPSSTPSAGRSLYSLLWRPPGGEGPTKGVLATLEGEKPMPFMNFSKEV